VQETKKEPAISQEEVLLCGFMLPRPHSQPPCWTYLHRAPQRSSRHQPQAAADRSQTRCSANNRKAWHSTHIYIYQNTARATKHSTDSLANSFVLIWTIRGVSPESRIVFNAWLQQSWSTTTPQTSSALFVPAAGI